ncbi:MAG: hypothetical protein M0R46_11595 [Candidatus Muirbacterium halophilum]|nr:hypothetical protein [Candidatus Muirbacterium halophilum]
MRDKRVFIKYENIRQTYWLNEHGWRLWKHKWLPYELDSHYWWVDSVSLLWNYYDEEMDYTGRRYVGEGPRYDLTNKSTFYDKVNNVTLCFEDFEPIQKYERRKKLERILKDEDSKET